MRDERYVYDEGYYGERVNRNPRADDRDVKNWGSARSDYGKNAYGGRLDERGLERHENRGLLDRAGDEVLSWLGDEEAERRRRMDALENERRNRYGNQRDYRSTNPYRNMNSSGRLHIRNDGRARNVMTNSVVCVNPDDTAEHAARMMSDCDCGSLPVVDRDRRLLGMVTDRDITIRLIARGIDARRARVYDCMTDNAYACHEYDSVEDCMNQMARHQIRRMPIVDDYHRVVGIVSQGDLAMHAAENAGTGERRAIADMLRELSEPSQMSHR